MKKVLINVEERELRVAILEDEQLVELYIEALGEKTILNNIYKGRIEGILPGLKAAFVNIGLERNAFLHFDDVRPDLLWAKYKEQNPEAALPPAPVAPEQISQPAEPASGEEPVEAGAVEGQDEAAADREEHASSEEAAGAEDENGRKRRRRGRRGGRRRNKQDVDQPFDPVRDEVLDADIDATSDEDEEPFTSEPPVAAAPVFEARHDEAQPRGGQPEGQVSQNQQRANARSERQRKRRERWEQKKLERQQRRTQQQGQGGGGGGRAPQPHPTTLAAAANWVPVEMRGAAGTRAAANPYDVFSPYSQPQQPFSKRQWRRQGQQEQRGNTRSPYQANNDPRDSQEDFFGPRPAAHRNHIDDEDDDRQPAYLSGQPAASEPYYDDEEDGPAPGNEKFPSARPKQHNQGGQGNRQNRRRGGRSRQMRKRGGNSYYAARAKKGVDAESENEQDAKLTQEKETKAPAKRATRKKADVAPVETPVETATTEKPKRTTRKKAEVAPEASPVEAAEATRKTTRSRKAKAEEAPEAAPAEQGAEPAKPKRTSRKKAEPADDKASAPAWATTAPAEKEPSVAPKPSRGRKKAAATQEPASAEKAAAEQQQPASDVPAARQITAAEPTAADTAPQTEVPQSDKQEEAPVQVQPEEGAEGRSSRRTRGRRGGRGRDRDRDRRGQQANSGTEGEPFAVDASGVGEPGQEPGSPAAEGAAAPVETPEIAPGSDAAQGSEAPAAPAGHRRERDRNRRDKRDKRDRGDRGDRGDRDRQPQAPRWNRPPLFTEMYKKGDEIMVQVIKEEIGTKGARISTYVSLPGRYLVLLPYPNEEGGISRKVEDITERKRLKRILREIATTETAFIIRTAGVYRPEEDIRSDVEFLRGEWNRIDSRYKEVEATGLVYDDHDILYRLARDVFDDNVGEIHIDSQVEADKLRGILRKLIPNLVDKVQLYSGAENIFHKYQVEKQIQKAARRKVWLKSGGYLIIDEAEALTAIDVNTGKAVGKDDQEKLILRTNLEASRAVARELKLRDIGGLIVIDFIDMKDYRNRDQVVNELKAHLRKDRSKTSVSTISEFGLVEMTRKRVRRSLRKTLFMDCPYCQGAGVVLNEQQIWLHIKHEIVGILSSSRPAPSLNITVASRIRAYVDQNYRDAIRRLEQRYDCEIRFTMSDVFHVENYAIERTSVPPAPVLSAASGGR